MKTKKIKRTALILSVCLLILWSLLGTGATLAWFTDTSPAVKNSFLIGMIDLDVFYKNDVVTEYTEVDAATSVFNDKALYEPGYTQVVKLRIENNGDIDFDYKLAIDINGYVDATNVYGENFHLPDHLQFGVIFGDSEAELDRELAQMSADKMMNIMCGANTYTEYDTTVKVGGERYAALIVYMPEEVSNEANYRGGKAPQVDLGITVYAQQTGVTRENP